MHKLSLRFWVIGGVLVTILSSVNLGTWFLLKDQRQKIILREQYDHYLLTRVLAIGLEKALWDLSSEQAYPLAKSVMKDPRIVKVQVFDDSGNDFISLDNKMNHKGEIISYEEDVFRGDRVLGSVVIEFSMAQADEEIHSYMVDFASLALVEFVACFVVLAFLLNYRVLRRIDRLKGQAIAMSRKELQDPFHWRDGDEIASLGQSLEITRKSLLELFSEVEKKNTQLMSMNQNLEKLVAERALTIKTIMDHVKTGFLLIDPCLTVTDGYSRSCEDLLKTTEISGNNLDGLLRLEGAARDGLNLALQQVFDDNMPEIVSLKQIPKFFIIDQQTISLEGSTVRDPSGSIKKILFTIINVTDLKAIEEENQNNRAIVNIMQNRVAFLEFIQDFRVRIASCSKAIKKQDIIKLRTELHTLKGNAATFGLSKVVNLIHETEDLPTIDQSKLNEFEDALRERLRKHSAILKLDYDQPCGAEILINERDLQELSQIIEEAASIQTVRNFFRNWIADVQRLEIANFLSPTFNYLHRIAEQRNVRFRINLQGGHVRILPQEAQVLIQFLIHLTRNAVDHGMEAVDLRGSKDPVATLKIIIIEEQKTFHVEVHDDGRGIDPDALLQRAIELGLVTRREGEKMSTSQKIELIYSVGLSTAKTVTDVSGRGIGIGGMREILERAGGSIRVETKRHKGSSFYLKIPRESLFNRDTIAV